MTECISRMTKLKCFLLHHIPSVDGKKVPDPKSIFGGLGTFNANVKCLRCQRKLIWNINYRIWVTEWF